jgi:phosphomannomutase
VYENLTGMTLVKSISGIRGTIGGKPGDCLSPVDIVNFAAGYGTWIKRRNNNEKLTVVIGRDARKSGPMVRNLIVIVLQNLGINVIDLDLATTPTVELAVTGLSANGGIIVTASHNPAEWNALKLLNEAGEFLSSDDCLKVLEIAENEDFEFVPGELSGSLLTDLTWGQKHISQILNLEIVSVEKIKSAKLTVAIDCINSVGAVILPELLKSLGVENVFSINSVPDGNFAHNPEPLPANLGEISKYVVNVKADAGFVVDPDVDRLAIICEDGSMFGEEYTLVSVADYVLRHSPGNTVSNLSSTKALKDITEKYGSTHFSSPVGEVNVVDEMKKRGAVIGGEGNGGVIYPKLHYGRDALAGIAIFLTHLAGSRMKCSSLRQIYPQYVISKKKLNLPDSIDFRTITEYVKLQFQGKVIDERDGLWIGFQEGWVQVRKSNTEPVMRIYAEGKTSKDADDLANSVIEIVNKI